MVSAHYIFHVYIMHHFRGKGILHRGLLIGYIIIHPKNNEVYMSSVETEWLS